MNNHRYYKVKRVTTPKKVYFYVIGYDSWWDMMIGFSVTYQKENDTLESAERQIDFLVQNRIIEEKTVIKKKV